MKTNKDYVLLIKKQKQELELLHKKHDAEEEELREKIIADLNIELNPDKSVKGLNPRMLRESMSGVKFYVPLYTGNRINDYEGTKFMRSYNGGYDISISNKNIDYAYFIRRVDALNFVRDVDRETLICDGEYDYRQVVIKTE